VNELHHALVAASPYLTKAFAIGGSVLGGIWAGVTLIINRRSENQAWIAEIFASLQTISTTVMEHPEIQEYLCRHYAVEAAAFMVGGSMLRDRQFIQAKTLVYWHLNVFDSIISRTRGSTWARRLLFSNDAELNDWETYILERLRHPLFRAILEEEGKIFGKSLQSYYEVHKAELSKTPPMQYLW